MADLELNDDTFGNIERYYKNAGRLTKKEQEKCFRLETAFAILRHQKNKTIAQKKYKDVMLNHGFALSPTDILRDFRESAMLFAPMQVYTKDFLRMVMTESAMKRIDMQEKKARKAYEVNSIAEYEKLIKLIQKDEELIMKINGLDSTDPEMPDFSKVEMTQINVSISPENSNLFKRILNQGSFDLNDIEEANETE